MLGSLLGIPIGLLPICWEDGSTHGTCPLAFLMHYTVTTEASAWVTHSEQSWEYADQSEEDSIQSFDLFTHYSIRQ